MATAGSCGTGRPGSYAGCYGGQGRLDPSGPTIEDLGRTHSTCAAAVTAPAALAATAAAHAATASVGTRRQTRGVLSTNETYVPHGLIPAIDGVRTQPQTATSHPQWKKPTEVGINAHSTAMDLTDSNRQRMQHAKPGSLVVIAAAGTRGGARGAIGLGGRHQSSAGDTTAAARELGRRGTRTER